ncbi:MAG: M23 family metallopeptidase [Bacteroidota bacterium]|jgi:murein DD-endopeptidase MepM/ murein hydrolase activator NlpD
MPTERRHHASKDTSFEIVVIPQGDAGSTLSFKASVMKIILAAVAVVLLISAVVVSLIVYTPVGLLLPMSEAQLKQRFGAELFDVQVRLNRVTTEVLVLREYNNKLRKALGQDPLSDDSVLAFSALTAVDQPSSAPAEVADSRDQHESNAGTEQTVSYTTASAGSEAVSFKASFPIIVPATGYVSRRFEADQGHNGIDYAGKAGSLIVAPADGYVIFSGYTVDDGYMILMSHGSGFVTAYKHNQSNLKSVGEFVKRGEPIALLGNTGRTSYGPHLHFELWKDGMPQNPDEYLIASKL